MCAMVGAAKSRKVSGGGHGRSRPTSPPCPRPGRLIRDGERPLGGLFWWRPVIE